MHFENSFHCCQLALPELPYPSSVRRASVARLR
jgi:hypothetical protein